MPSTSHQASASTVASTAGPFRRKQEMLVLLDLGALAGLHRDDGGPAGGEGKARQAGERSHCVRGARWPPSPASSRCEPPAVQLIPGPSGSRKS